MPYQLRRIVAINIRNSTTGLPSGIVSELDPRGSVLAVGLNGVGKTTFLRLLPLFYGATPQQILRGSGKSAMIAYTLPDASSAVAYEYERESKNDLRCVVMYCEPGEDRPQFRIIENGGFREELFYDEDGYFVSREEFPARAESLGARLSPKLPLHLYRSVILNERLHTKEGMRMRELAARHSLGSHALTHLDQIAAAMANEKISFRDLQNIVIDRVADMGATDRPNVSTRELRKSRKDVVKWIEDRDHLARVMTQEPQAKSLSQRIDRIRTAHHQMCSLHVAAKAASVQIEGEKTALAENEEAARLAFDGRAASIREQLVSWEARLLKTRTESDAASQAFSKATDQAAYFAKINAKHLSEQQDKEHVYKIGKANSEKELERLTGAAGALQKKASERRSEIEQDASRQQQEISERAAATAREQAEQITALRQEEDAAMEALSAPTRPADIAKERDANLSRLGELKGILSNPMPTAESAQRLEDAIQDEKRLRSQHEESSKHKLDAEKAERDALASLSNALQDQAAAKSFMERAEQELNRLQAQLEPAAGSLLEYLRKTDSKSWSQAARVLDPQLLVRTDLHPTENAEHVGDVQGVVLGSLMLDVCNVAEPDWVDMAQLRHAIAKAQSQCVQEKSRFEQAEGQSKASAKVLNAIKEELATKTAAEGLKRTALAAANKAVERLRNAVAQEKQQCKDNAETERVKLAQTNEALENEARQIVEAYQAQQCGIRESFRALHSRLDAENRTAETRFAEEHAAVLGRKEKDLQQLEEDVARELKGLGVDPHRIQSVRRELSEFDAWLRSIAENRHEVVQWRLFERGTSPKMEFLKAMAETAKTDLQQAQKGLAHVKDLEGTLSEEMTQAKRLFDDQRERINREASVLADLLASSLKDFVAFGASASEDVEWSVPDLQKGVHQCRKEINDEAEQLTSQARRLRDVMAEHDSPVAHWVEQRERELPDAATMLDHEYRSLRARVLCDWFLPEEEARVSYITQMHQEMDGFLAVAGNFVQDLDVFEKRVDSFNKELQAALGTVKGFRRFRNLSVQVISSVGQIGAVSTLRQMQNVLDSKTSTYGAFVIRRRELPTEEEAILIRKFRDIIPSDGALRVNLNEQVRLECSLMEGNTSKLISSDEEFKAISSTGNTALITAMFLMGFVEMIRKKDSSVRLAWVTDEVGRFDPANLREFLHTLDAHKIDVISASPSADPAQSRFFSRLCIFEESGAIETTELRPPETHTGSQSDATVQEGLIYVGA